MKHSTTGAGLFVREAWNRQRRAVTTRGLYNVLRIKWNTCEQRYPGKRWRKIFGRWSRYKSGHEDETRDRAVVAGEHGLVPGQTPTVEQSQIYSRLLHGESAIHRARSA